MAKRRGSGGYLGAPSFDDPREEALYEALCYYYWGAQDYARELLMALTEKVLNDEETKTSDQAAKSPTIDYDDRAGQLLPGNDQYPWDGWRFH